MGTNVRRCSLQSGRHSVGSLWGQQLLCNGHPSHAFYTPPKESCCSMGRMQHGTVRIHCNHRGWKLMQDRVLHYALLTSL